MAEIVRLEGRRRRNSVRTNQIIQKSVDGKIVECVDLDALTTTERQKYFAQDEDARRSSFATTRLGEVVTLPL